MSVDLAQTSAAGVHSLPAKYVLMSCGSLNCLGLETATCLSKAAHVPFACVGLSFAD